jgi:primosomal protein N'
MKLRNEYRYHFRLQAAAVEHIQRLWRDVSPRLEPAGEVEMTIDVDPLDMR